MEVTQVRVRNYKSIKDTGWVPIEEDVTTLLGRNESGKTSFLEAINYFTQEGKVDETELHDEEDYPDDHCVPITEIEIRLDQSFIEKIPDEIQKKITKKRIVGTKYSDGSRDLATLDGTQIPPISEPIEYVQDEGQEMWDDLNSLRNQHSGGYRIHFDNNIKSPLNNLRNNNNPSITQLSNWVETLLDAVDDIPEQNSDIEKEKKHWHSKLESIQILLQLDQGPEELEVFPPIIYHGGFDSISDRVSTGAIENQEHRTFRNLLEIAGIDHDNFTKLDYFEQNRELDNASIEIKGEVNRLWKQKEVDVSVSYRDNQFSIGIKDTALGSSDSETDRVDRELKRPSDRSKGFQWFLSFYINLQAETNGVESSNQLFLLDDPAVFLHPEGKKNWLDAIEDLAESAQIIYSSHSPFLIRKAYPNRIRVVEDRETKGTVISEEFYDSDEMALKPLRNALGIGLGDTPFASKRKILVEGVSDYNILTGIANYYRDHVGEDILDWGEVNIMPTNGADNMIRAAKWVSAEEFSYALLLDNDQKGKEIQDRLEEDYQEIDSDRAILLQKDDEQRNYNIEIEDMFSPEFFVDCVNKAYSDHLSNFDQIEIEQSEDGWLIGGHEYKGRKMANRIDDAFDDRDLGDLDKILVSNEIQDRLSNDRDVAESDVEEFKSVLGEIRSLT